MTAGFNALVDVVRYGNEADDYRGGAIQTGTPLYLHIPMRITPVEPTMALIQQGVEVTMIMRGVLGYDAKDISEYDNILVVGPDDSQYLGEDFKVISVQHSSMRANDPRSHLVVWMRRRENGYARQT